MIMMEMPTGEEEEEEEGEGKDKRPREYDACWRAARFLVDLMLERGPSDHFAGRTTFSLHDPTQAREAAAGGASMIQLRAPGLAPPVGAAAAGSS
jgi:hypothetical protein